MAKPTFVDGIDSTTFMPFSLIDARGTECNDIRLQFDDWAWLDEKYNTEYINDYYLNGGNVQGLVLAARVAAGLDACADGMELNSDGNTCFIHFKELQVAVHTAELAQKMINDRDEISRLADIAREHDFED